MLDVLVYVKLVGREWEKLVLPGLEAAFAGLVEGIPAYTSVRMEYRVLLAVVSESCRSITPAYEVFEPLTLEAEFET